MCIVEIVYGRFPLLMTRAQRSAEAPFLHRLRAVTNDVVFFSLSVPKSSLWRPRRAEITSENAEKIEISDKTDGKKSQAWSPQKTKKINSAKKINSGNIYQNMECVHNGPNLRSIDPSDGT